MCTAVSADLVKTNIPRVVWFVSNILTLSLAFSSNNLTVAFNLETCHDYRYIVTDHSYNPNTSSCVQKAPSVEELFYSVGPSTG